jgi:tol-pal system protein YbgF
MPVLDGSNVERGERVPLPSSDQRDRPLIRGGIAREAMMVRYFVWPLLLGVALLSSACTVTTEQFQALQQDVRSLRGDVNTLAAKERASSAARPTELVSRLEELAVETRMVQGQLEENNYRLSELAKRLDETELKVARLLAESRKPVDSGQAPVAPGAVPPPVQGAGPQPPPSPPPLAGQPLPAPGGGVSPPQALAPGPGQRAAPGSLPSPDEAYTQALNDYTKGNYDLAINGFRTYLTYYPKTSLVPNAQYWLAYSYYSKRDYPSAIREFDKLIKEYPDSAKVPDAMLKKGYAYLELGEKAQGQGVLRELMAKFPKSREARLAQDRLERPQ